MAANSQSEELHVEEQSAEESGAACDVGGCPPSHRLMRRVSLAIIAVLILLILAVGIWLLAGSSA